MLHGHVGGFEQGVDHVGGDILGEAGKDLVLHQRVAHQGMVG